MFRPKILVPLLLAASTIACPALASPQTMRLFQVFQDPNHTRPASDLIYHLQLNGRHLQHGITDESGSIVIDHRKPKTRQEFVADILGIGTRLIVVDAKDQTSVEALGNLDAEQQHYESCSSEAGNCVGKGFYWIRLLGVDSQFASEPYSLTMDSTTHVGTVDNNGYIFVPANSPPNISKAYILQLCAGPAIQLRSGTNEKDSEFTMLESSKVNAPSPENCKTSSLKQYMQHHADLNRGMPYIFSQWAIGQTPKEIVEQQRLAVQALQDAYKAHAAANNDRLAWLGVLPPTWSDDEYTRRMDKLYDRLMADMSLEKEDILQFKCRTPAQVGAVPNMKAVDAFIKAFSTNTIGPKELAQIYVAAAKGNWLAVAQVYSYESQFSRDDDNPYLRKYRLLQLKEWLQARKIGIVYSFWGDDLNASGLITDGPYYYAALHNSYPSQYEIGKKLAKAPDERSRVIGRKMQACAMNALPAYRQHFESTRTK